jgi:hypothetical protein
MPTPDQEILEALRRHGVPFLIIGGHAVNFHGYSRTTEDLDVIWLRTGESETLLLNALTEIDAQYIGNDIDPATGIERTYPVSASFIRITHLMMLWTRHGFLDLFDYVPGFPKEDVNQLFQSSVQAGNNRFTSLDWLRKMKRASGRSKDLLDLENLPPEG